MPLSRPLFYPSPDPTTAQGSARDLRIEVEPGIAVAARHYPHPKAEGTVLYFHGNGEVLGDHDAIARSFHDVGLALFVVTYRGYGSSDGTPTLAALVADTHPIARRFHGLLDAEAFAGLRLVMGRSLGGHAALEIASRCPDRFDALVLSSPAGEGSALASRLDEAPANAVRALLAAHEAKLASIELPTLLLHGRDDPLIPLASVERLATLLPAATERTLVTFEGVGHNDVLSRAHDQYFEDIRHLVERCLERKRNEDPTVR